MIDGDQRGLMGMPGIKGFLCRAGELRRHTGFAARNALYMVSKLTSAPLSPEVVWTSQRADIPWREDEQRRINLLSIMRYRRLSPITDSAQASLHLSAMSCGIAHVIADARPSCCTWHAYHS